MFLFYCDESNLGPTEGDFFVYGGLSIPVANASSLSERIETIRASAQIPNNFKLKFNPGPQGMKHQDFISVKKDVIQAAIDAQCTLFVSFLLHGIASDPDTARRNEINRVCFHFNCMLVQHSDYGLVLIDRFEDRHIDYHLREKFSVGLRDMPYSETMRLSKILGFHYSAIGQSHFPSVVDIIIGSIRFCINEHTRNPENPAGSCSAILNQLAPLFPITDCGVVPENNLFFSPKIVKVDKYRVKYEKLRSFFQTYGISPVQKISSTRDY